jgi:hypothetical protein
VAERPRQSQAQIAISKEAGVLSRLRRFTDSTVPRHLAYTLALEHPPGSMAHWTMAKMLVLSLLRTRFDGDIVVFKTCPEPLFLVPRMGVREVLIDAGEPGALHFWDHAQAWKFRVREHLEVNGYDKVIFLDADCLALRNIDPLLEGNWDVRAYAEPNSWVGHRIFNCFVSEKEAKATKAPGINGGLLAVRAALYHEVMQTWERINFGPSPRSKEFTDQAALTRLILDTALRKHFFTRKEVGMPLSHDPRAQDYSRCVLIHAAGAKSFEEKLRFMFGLYLSTFFFDRQAMLLHILDA